MSRKHYLLRTLLLFFSLFALSSSQAQESDFSKNIYLILDGSSSMWGQVDSLYKIEIVRDAILNMVEELPSDTKFSLTVYGHTKKGDCKDVELMIPLIPLSKELIIERVESINPTGKSPIASALEMVLQTMKENRDTATVLLLSDGLETCEGDPCKLVAESLKEDLSFLLHIIGFGVGDNDVSQLECTAQAGGGLYFDAQNAEELTSALHAAMDLASGNAGYLSMQSLANDSLQDALITVRDTAGQVVTRARTYQNQITNPRVLPLIPGIYDLSVEALQLKGNTLKKLDSLVITPRDTLSQSIDFQPGQLSIEIKRNGNLSDATVAVYFKDSTEQLTVGRTYTRSKSNPFVVNLTPGAYVVKVTSMELEDRSSIQLDSIAIQAGKKMEKAHEFRSGALKVGATHQGKLLDVVLKVIDNATNKEVTQARTFNQKESNPRTFELSPGTYRVELAPADDALETKEIKVRVDKGKLTEKIVNFE